MREKLPLDLEQRLKEESALKGRPSRARYNKAHATLEGKWRRRELKAERMMREVVDVLWDHFAGNPYSWCGFYVLTADAGQMVLGAHRDKPACSPLAMHGVCGKVALSGEAMIVADVKALGAAHIECDPRNLSEIALPVFDKDNKVWAVLDIDSEQRAAFNEMDQRWLEKILRNFTEVGRVL